MFLTLQFISLIYYAGLVTGDRVACSLLVVVTLPRSKLTGAATCARSYTSPDSPRCWPGQVPYPHDGHGMARRGT
ncbi:hypothetical protein PVAP13_9KG282613 [Panicum virgatum]|uniref:Secreted protein n=1 Tax=Panicum virgatum TaxID=38727 RepID=A0A8T0NPF2_PANVG|nr:hypothetical protein PVAP13_9KG282613 [Panicum virgatum]